MKKKWVKILFPNITHSGKMYNIGDIEKDPSEYLMDAAKRKVKQFHRDSDKEIRICRFVRSDDDETDDEINDKPKRSPAVFIKGGFDDDLSDKSHDQLITLVSTLGLKKSLAKTIVNNDKLKEIITLLRTI